MGEVSFLWLKNGAEPEKSTENLISPLFGVVRDLQNRQKSAFLKLTENGLFSHFRLIGLLRVKLRRLLKESNITLLFYPLIQNRKCYFSARQRTSVLTYYPHPINQNKR